ncbi:uncharacterized protein LOC118223945 isoform X1 [Anguilla anguilla]|uniref:uncharacterized protein LOC118223945 isoform X1 n=1 Tax=Anguilla anguilla TaxID=7936 RepID=UPI0015B22ED0|nr:uncharacterized protein LOC118223945 isoform X1 [Anguilla anguilla]
MRWSQSVEGELAGACAAGLLPLPSPSARFSSQFVSGRCVKHAHTEAEPVRQSGICLSEALGTRRRGASRVSFRLLFPAGHPEPHHTCAFLKNRQRRRRYASRGGTPSPAGSPAELSSRRASPSAPPLENAIVIRAACAPTCPHRNFSGTFFSCRTHSAMVSMLWRKSGSTVLSLWMNRSDGRSPGFTPGPGAYRGSPLVCACVAPLSPCLLKQLCAGPPILPPPALAHSFSCKDAAKSVLKDVFAAMCELSPVFPCSFPEVPKCLY